MLTLLKEKEKEKEKPIPIAPKKDYKNCLFCIEKIKEEATHCKYCGKNNTKRFVIIKTIFLTLLFINVIFHEIIALFQFFNNN